MLDGDFFYMLADGLAMMVQYNHKHKLCTNLTGMARDASDEDVMENAARLIQSHFGPTFGQDCFYNTACLSDPKRYHIGDTSRSWRWQKCYELAYLQSAPLEGAQNGGAPLPPSLRSWMVNMSYMVSQCYAVFGLEIFSNTPPNNGAIEFATSAVNAKLGGPQPLASKV